MNARPLFVNQEEAAAMLGMSVKSFCKLKKQDHRLMPAVIPDTEMKRYLVSDLEEWARWVKYPQSGQDNDAGGMWSDEGAA